MRNVPLYPNAKPIDADVLILCEGDSVGYETELLKTWADGTDLNGRFVKVMACGTSAALPGMADAVGRTIPVIVVEDRDFRTADEARKECEKNLKNREGRNVAMRGWIAWQRAEIENYFTDDAVLPSVFAEDFKCSQDDVRDAVRSALNLLPIAQSLDFVRYRLRKSWDSTASTQEFRFDAIEWTQNGPQPRTMDWIRGKLYDRWEKWCIKLSKSTDWKPSISGEQLLIDFDRKCDEWSNLPYESPIWRRDWGCKEVIKHVRMILAQSRPGWWGTPDHPNQPVDWQSMPNDKTRDAHDRFIERQIQPKLVNSVTNLLRNGDSFDDLRTELESLATIIRNA